MLTATSVIACELVMGVVLCSILPQRKTLATGYGVYQKALADAFQQRRPVQLLLIASISAKISVELFLELLLMLPTIQISLDYSDYCLSIQPGLQISEEYPPTYSLLIH